MTTTSSNDFGSHRKSQSSTDTAETYPTTSSCSCKNVPFAPHRRRPECIDIDPNLLTLMEAKMPQIKSIARFRGDRRNGPVTIKKPDDKQEAIMPDTTSYAKIGTAAAVIEQVNLDPGIPRWRMRHRLTPRFTGQQVSNGVTYALDNGDLRFTGKGSKAELYPANSLIGHFTPSAISRIAERAARAEKAQLPVCPDHRIKFIKRQNKFNGSAFYGCPTFDKTGCRNYAAQKATGWEVKLRPPKEIEVEPETEHHVPNATMMIEQAGMPYPVEVSVTGQRVMRVVRRLFEKYSYEHSGTMVKELHELEAFMDAQLANSRIISYNEDITKGGDDVSS